MLYASCTTFLCCIFNFSDEVLSQSDAIKCLKMNLYRITNSDVIVGFLSLLPTARVILGQVLDIDTSGT